MGFQQGLSGVNAASKFLDVVGNNVANANTVGYKGSRAEFADIFANTLGGTSTQTGIGGRTASVAQQFSQGNLSTTNNALDVAIQGNGFFRLIDTAGGFSYSRNGQFQLDRQGYITNGTNKLAGYLANADGQLITGTTPQAIQIRTANIGAQATGASGAANAGLTLAMNFDARSNVVGRGTSTVSINGLQLDNAAAAGTQVNYQTRVTDSTGQFHDLDVQLTKLAGGGWNIATDLDNSGTFTNSANPLVFNALGQIQSGSPAAVSYALASPTPAYGNTPLNFNINFSGATEITGGTVPGAINVNDTAAQNMSVMVANSNLPNGDAVGAVHTFSGSYRDANGDSHSLDVTLTKAAANTWTPSVTIDGAPFTITPTPSPVTFNEAGLLSGGSPIAITGAAGGADFKINLQGLTQNAATFTSSPLEVRSTPPVVPTDPSTYTHSTSATVYDSQGVEHTLTYYFTKVGVNAWEVQSSFDGGTPVTHPGYITFDQVGNLNGGTSLAYSSPIPSPSGALSPLAFNTSFAGTSQFGSQFGVSELTQDGYADGNITGLSIGKDGVIIGRYSNGQNRTVGQITLYNFANPQGLQPLGDNRWAETFASNQARLGVPGSGDFGSLQSGAVEDSNIDLTKELVDMITAQRSYQANAQTIRTQDQVLQTLINLR
ncbi:flagellar hook protein FlgE [Chitinimonas koreensis]|uniref:flagellar hook protein FlgE n=1 Tax=Chitinimonas koreensis TaxID=356302 RepID=UPI000428F1F7|nr:flagellar hook protein FlgE [Chitinimonas koreensis]